MMFAGFCEFGWILGNAENFTIVRIFLNSFPPVRFLSEARLAHDPEWEASFVEEPMDSSSEVHERGVALFVIAGPP